MRVEISMRGEMFTVELDEGATGKDLKNKLNLPALYLVYGQQMDLNAPLKKGDKIEVVFVVGGG